ncbi:MAG TPA: glycosyl hydrolase [Candidatus Acidoferrum sp.]|nr:glycosyl hydrolase [Candidatus Acidoferrum sp.]
MKCPHCIAGAGLLLIALLGGSTLPLPAATNALAWPALTAPSRPWTWWWWHGSAVDETNITRELQRFHDAGLGGVQITAIFGTKGAEARDIPYLSPRWLAMMGYTVDEARRLGLGVTMTLGTGWCFGGPTVSDEDANASVVVKTFDLGAGERLTEKFDRKTTQALVAFGPDGKSIDLTGSITTNGEVLFSPPGNWTGTNATPPKTWTVYAISQKPSGQKVKRAAPGGEGWMLNPAYPQAVTNWLKWFDAAFANYRGSKPEAVFQDSYEYRTDWAPDFFAQFEKRRGYKLQTELPALFPDASSLASQASTDHIARVKYDYRRTLSEIMSQQSGPAWIDWAHKNGFSTIYQAHGTPGNWLDLYGDADMPETELFHNDRSILISKFASSAAHTQGWPFNGAETGTWLKEHFTETLADLKYLADDMFLAGVNRIFYHGACYSPDDAPWPGWLFYASTEMNPRNPIWHDVQALNDYIARCQSILQSGQPDNDVLLYWPVADFWSQPDGLVQPMSVSKTDWFENQPIGRAAHELWNRGYAFDYVSDAQLLQAKVVEGKIRMPGSSYQVIVVPECKFMPLETFKQLLTLAKKGATVIFENSLPSGVPGFNKLDKRHAEFKKLVSSLSFRKRETPAGNWEEARLGKGFIFRQDSIAKLFCVNAAHEPIAERGLFCIRRSFDDGWNYFIANRTTTNFNGWISLAHPAKSVVVLDPLSGESGVAAVKKDIPDLKGSFLVGEVYAQLAAGQSVILRAYAGEEIDGRNAALRRPAGAERRPYPYWQPQTPDAKSQTLTGDWKIKFLEGGPTLPADFQTAQLASWTTFPDTNCQAFAGTAKYEITFEAPNSPSAIRHPQFFLDIGDVRQSARVKLNGKDYGTLIAPPFRVVVDNLQPTGNVLEVEVTSVAANRIRDLDRRGVQWKIFKDINIANENYRPFNAADWPLTDCGLLGPVTLTAVSPWSP